MKPILHTSYITLADCEFSDVHNTIPADGSVVFVHMEHIPLFFRTISRTKNKYVLISANSDYSFVFQEQYPVWADLQAWLQFITIDAGFNYSTLVVPGRCDTSDCRLSELFSIKVYSYTKSTLDSIPSNIVKWFVTNCDVSHPIIEHIPFGIPAWNADMINLGRTSGNHTGSQRPINCYMNFEFNTLERVKLFEMYKDVFTSYKSGRSHDEFVSDLFHSEYVIAPPGNGFDSFRILESIYCGAVPIIVDTEFNKAYDGLPVVKITNFGQIPEIVSKKSEINRGASLDNTPADLLYWAKKIFQAKKSLKS